MGFLSEESIAFFNEFYGNQMSEKPMAQQKLYTEEQVKRAMLEYSSYSKPTMIQVIDTLKPIELPSDEGAGVIALKIVDALEDKLTSSQEAFVIAGFATYNKWLKAQILNQTK